MMRQAVRPALGNEAAFAQGVDIRIKPEGHDIGRLFAADHRARLTRGAAMRLPDVHRLAGLGLIFGGELLVDALVEFARRIIGDVEQGVGDAGVEVLHRDEADRDDDGATAARLRQASPDNFGILLISTRLGAPPTKTNIVHKIYGL